MLILFILPQAEVLDLSRIFSSYPNGTVVQRETLSDSIVSIMNAHEDVRQCNNNNNNIVINNYNYLL